MKVVIKGDNQSARSISYENTPTIDTMYEETPFTKKKDSRNYNFSSYCDATLELKVADENPAMKIKISNN
jgi:hypothetical protein